MLVGFIIYSLAIVILSFYSFKQSLQKNLCMIVLQK